MDLKALAALLRNIREGAGAALNLVEEEIERISQFEKERKVCQHPEKERLDLSRMGVSSWQCKKCGYVHEEVMK